MTYAIRIMIGALLEWLREAERRMNKHLGPWLCPRRCD